MLTINKCLPQGRGLAPALLRRAATIELTWDTRQKSRFDAVDSAGRAIGVFLPRGSVVRGGDVLLADDGSLIRVQAAAQPVLRITPCAQHGSPFDLTRAAYHLGNRHVAIELQPEHLQIEPDHVLAQMLVRMHLDVAAVDAAFEPEAGAYQSQHRHGGDGLRSGEAAGSVAHQHGAEGADGHVGEHLHGHAHEPERAHEHAHMRGHEHEHIHARTPGDAHDDAHGHPPGHAHDDAREHTHDPAHRHGGSRDAAQAHGHAHRTDADHPPHR